MLLSTLDLALRAGATALLLILAALLFRDFRGAIAGRLAVAFALGSAAHAVTYGIGATSPVSIGHAPLIALSTGNIVVFWLFTRALFDDAFKMRWRHALLWTAVAGFSFINCAWIAPASGNVRFSIIAINLLVLGFIALAAGQTIASWSADLVEGRRRLRVFIVSAAALYGGINAVLQILVSGREAADVANAIYGGSFSSRLVANIREDKGYTYSPFSSLNAYRVAGTLVTRADVRNEVTAPSLNEIEYELNRLATTTPTSASPKASLRQPPSRKYNRSSAAANRLASSARPARSVARTTTPRRLATASSGYSEMSLPPLYRWDGASM